MRRLRRLTQDGGAARLAVVIAVFATFSEALLTDHAFFQRDVDAYWYPRRAVIDRALSEPSWPLWNPFVAFGLPLLAEASSELAYPPTWLGLLFSPPVHYKLFAIGHTLWAAAGAWALVRRLGGGRGAGGVAAATYALSGPLLSAVNLFHHHVGASWLPWSLWALEGLVRAPRVGSVLLLALTSAAQILAGSGDMCLVGAILGAGRLAWALARRPPAARILSLARHGTSAAALALALGAVQWLPTAAVARHAHRASQDPRTSTYWSLHPASLVDLSMPRLVSGLPLTEAGRGELFEGREPLLTCLYLGIVPLGLAILGITEGSRIARAAAGGFAFFVLAALGRHTRFYDVLLLVPGISILRYPTKFLLPASLCAAVMAAFGFEAWNRKWPPAERRRAFGVALALVGCAVLIVGVAAWTLGGAPSLARLLEPGSVPEASRTTALLLLRTALVAAAFGWLLTRRASVERAGPGLTITMLLLGAGDLVAVGRSINPLVRGDLIGQRPAVLEDLPADTRIMSTSESGACVRPAPSSLGGDRQWAAARAFRETLRPPTASRWGLRGSFDGEFTGLGSRWDGLFTDAVNRFSELPSGIRLLQTANVGRVLHIGNTPPTGLQLLDRRPTPYACPLLVLRVPDPLPAAYVVHHERTAAGPEATLATLLTPGFDPRTEVVVDAPSEPHQAVADAGADQARIVARRGDRLEVAAELQLPGTLVVVEAYDPGWQVLVDGQPAALVRANGLFRGVRLPAGRHEVHFRYRPRSVTIGAALSLLGLLGSIALAATQASAFATRSPTSRVE